MRVAVVQNHDHAGVINRFGQCCLEEYDCNDIKNIIAALQEYGHETLLCEGDKGLLATLERFMPPDPRVRPSGIVFNLANGIQGECRLSHVPAMLELAGVPYTGAGPLGNGLALDKVIAKILMRDCGVPTPNFRVMRRGTESTGDLRFPLVVKPRFESTSFGLRLVHEPVQLRQAVEAVATQYAQDALVEEYIEGREIYVGLLGNGKTETLPLVERDFGDRELRLYTHEDKGHAALAAICPAQLDSKLATFLRDISVATFRACQCRDYARVDIRIDRSGQPFVLEINSIPALNGVYIEAAATAGYNFSSLINRILDIAYTRYFGSGASNAK
ncbi:MULTISPECIES: D-alanine--D-alanine ligase family protein [Bradyrhizobium]|uniref:D-alanine--D-alanine ligase family protein n=1 Tax=Bradyrhizobium centrosematis TaxID=1300039 RepID=UPI002166CF11|nr:ATP-grasp domain-containing protein [Bradyrhizobium centrosematis]MCS3765663.1 D-alanine-D-alanine ligase [Bradyrhizobium centrosematis]MCS3777889.1 D-alanine-D-alanine ligase [Bradyrhizobium centrosematis]